MTLVRSSATALFASIVLISCGGTTTVDTGASFDFAFASVDEARAVLELAVRQECAKSNVGVSAGLASALRSVESAIATRLSANWEFRSGGKVATVSPSGRVSGNLLRDLTSEC